MEKTTKNILIVLAIIVVVIIGTRIGSNVTGSATKVRHIPKPRLSVDKEMDSKFSLSKGYYAEFEGWVRNSGDASANNVRVTCQTKRNNAVIGSNTIPLGSISAGGSSQFVMDVDFEGNKQYVGYCKATCSKC